MKIQLRTLLATISAAVLLVSCHGDLDTDQTTGLPSDKAWENQTDAVANMNGMMSTFRAAFATDYMYWGEYRTGLWGKGLETQPSRDEVYNNTIKSNHAQTNWTNLYTTINHANLVLKYTPGITFVDPKLKNQVMGSAYFTRAFCYYWIGRIWGDAPVLLEGFESDKQNIYPSRDEASKVFGQVDADIASAIELLSDMTSGVRNNMPTKEAAYTLQTDFYLWMYKVRTDASALAKARTACTNALNASKTGTPVKKLLDNFADIFSVTSKLNAEVIFAWSMIKDEKEGGFQADWLVPLQYVSDKYIETQVKCGSHQQWAAFTPAYKAIIDAVATDTRKRVSYNFFFDDGKNTTLQWVGKYVGTWTGGARSFNSDIIVYRYADLLLFDAEIKNEQNLQGDAITAINDIAKRAYGVASYYSAPQTKADINTILLTERQREFAAEGKLWWDYLRFGVAFTKVPGLAGRSNENNILLWPVNQDELDDNKNLVQTDFSVL